MAEGQKPVTQGPSEKGIRWDKGERWNIASQWVDTFVTDRIRTLQECSDCELLAHCAACLEAIAVTATETLMI